MGQSSHPDSVAQYVGQIQHKQSENKYRSPFGCLNRIDATSANRASSGSSSPFNSLGSYFCWNFSADG
jgi:hypothetical protein